MDFHDIKIYVSKVSDGNMSVNWGPEEEVIKNRKIFLQKNRIKYEDCVWASLKSGTEVQEVSKVQRGKYVVGDALITSENNLALAMVTGDCLPVTFYDSKNKIIGLAHLGWRGVEGKLALKVIKRLSDEVKIFIGPGVRQETYIKYGEKLKYFKDQINSGEWNDFLIEKAEGKFGVDLVGLVKRQLMSVGVKQGNIEVSGVDTIKDIEYFSHYRSGMTGEKEGRFMTVVVRK